MRRCAPAAGAGAAAALLVPERTREPFADAPARAAPRVLPADAFAVRVPVAPALRLVALSLLLRAPAAVRLRVLVALASRTPPEPVAPVCRAARPPAAPAARLVAVPPAPVALCFRAPDVAPVRVPEVARLRVPPLGVAPFAVLVPRVVLVRRAVPVLVPRAVPVPVPVPRAVLEPLPPGVARAERLLRAVRVDVVVLFAMEPPVWIGTRFRASNMPLRCDDAGVEHRVPVAARAHVIDAQFAHR